MRRILLILFVLLPFAPILAQDHLAKTISLTLRQKPLSQALQEIGRKGNFYFSYNTAILDGDSLVNVNETGKTVRQILDGLLGEAYDYRESGRYVILLLKTTLPPTRIYTVSGMIRDGNSNQKLPNVSVYESGQLVSALTDTNGFFRLKLKDKYAVATIVISKQFYRDTLLLVEPGRDQQISVSIVPAPVAELSPFVVRSRLAKSFWSRFFLSSRQVIQSVNLLDFFADRHMQFSLTPGLGTNGRMSGQVVDKFSFNAVGGYTGGVNGFELGGVFNIDQKEVKYFQAAGVFNVAGGFVRGLQMAGIHNHDLDSMNGVQAAGISNVVMGAFSGVQLGGIINHVEEGFRGVQAAGILNVDGDFIQGWQKGSIPMHASDTLHGVQLGGIANVVAGNFSGVQVGGIMNFVEGKLKGVQLSGFVNLAGDSIRQFGISGWIHQVTSRRPRVPSADTTAEIPGSTKGFQIAGLANFSKAETRGVQISGFLNYSRKLKGVQIGLINVADSSDGYMIGVINIAKHGIHELTVSSNEMLPLTLSYKAGSRKLYSIFLAGASMGIDNRAYSIGFGIGHELPISRVVSLSDEFFIQHFYLGSWKRTPGVLRLQPSLRIKAAKGLSFFAGPALSWYAPHPLYPVNGYKTFLPGPGYHTFPIGNSRAWLGWSIGINFF